MPNINILIFLQSKPRPSRYQMLLRLSSAMILARNFTTFPLRLSNLLFYTNGFTKYQENEIMQYFRIATRNENTCIMASFHETPLSASNFLISLYLTRSSWTIFPTTIIFKFQVDYMPAVLMYGY